VGPGVKIVIRVHVKHYIRICTSWYLNFCVDIKKNRITRIVLKGRPGGQEKNGSKNRKNEKQKRVTGSQESANHEIRSPNPPSLQCHLMFVLQGAIQQLNLVDHNDIYKDIYVTTCKSETNICI